MKDESRAGSLLAEQAYRRLIALLRDGGLGSGQFLSMPALVEMTGFALAATREAVKRADAHGLVTVLPKRGVLVMDAGPEVTRDALDLRALFDAESARRLVAAGHDLPLAALRDSHARVLDAARHRPASDLPKTAMAVDLSLHDALATGLGNRLAAAAYAINRDRIAVIQNTRPFLLDRVASAMEEHLAIIDALERREVDAAVAAVHRHHRATLRWWGVDVAR